MSPYCSDDISGVSLFASVPPLPTALSQAQAMTHIVAGSRGRDTPELLTSLILTGGFTEVIDLSGRPLIPPRVGALVVQNK